MKKRIIGYRERVDALLARPPAGADWNDILNEHMAQVSFFQHERLIHLIVTVTFAIFCLEDISTQGVANHIETLVESFC